MENGKLFLALALGMIDREAEQRAALLGGNGRLGGLPRLVAYANQNAPRISARGATYISNGTKRLIAIIFKVTETVRSVVSTGGYSTYTTTDALGYDVSIVHTYNLQLCINIFFHIRKQF